MNLNNMRIPKRYGSSRVDTCPFCGKQSTTSNKQGVPVCITHKDKELLDLKCQCGDWLDITKGKYGPYFKCMKCGNVSFSRGLELNEEKLKEQPKKQEPVSKINHYPWENKKKEKTITSDEIDAYYS